MPIKYYPEAEFAGEKVGKARTKAKKEFKSLDKNGDKSLSFKEFRRR
jgi:hypothetical protein